MELAGRTLRVDVGRVAAQANGAALMHYGGDGCIINSDSFRKTERRN